MWDEIRMRYWYLNTNEALRSRAFPAPLFLVFVSLPHLWWWFFFLSWTPAHTHTRTAEESLHSCLHRRKTFHHVQRILHLYRHFRTDLDHSRTSHLQHHRLSFSHLSGEYTSRPRLSLLPCEIYFAICAVHGIPTPWKTPQTKVRERKIPGCISLITATRAQKLWYKQSQQVWLRVWVLVVSFVPKPQGGREGGQSVCNCPEINSLQWQRGVVTKSNHNQKGVGGLLASDRGDDTRWLMAAVNQHSTQLWFGFVGVLEERPREVLLLFLRLFRLFVCDWLIYYSFWRGSYTSEYWIHYCTLSASRPLHAGCKMNERHKSAKCFNAKCLGHTNLQQKHRKTKSFGYTVSYKV